MLQKIQLTIPKPCHQNWHQMTQAQQGRFCNACATPVIDFSQMTDAELLQFFTENTTQRYCGRIFKHQLQKNLLPLPPKKQVNLYAGLFFLLLFFFIEMGHIKAQPKTNANSYSFPVRSSDHLYHSPAKDTAVEVNNSRAISGKIYNSSGFPLAGATVRQINSTQFFVTKGNGSFVFMLQQQTVQFKVSAPGYQTKIITISAKNHYEITLQKERVICPERPIIMGKIQVRMPEK